MVTTPLKSSIPVELMEILHRINENVSDVKERVIRLESQNHADSLKTIWTELEKEREKRIKLEIEISSLKTKLAPITIGISILAAAIIQFLLHTV